MSLQQTSSQTVGPYFIIGLRTGVVTNLANGDASGAPVVLRGRVLDGADAPVSDAVIETWQADTDGRYKHPEDPHSPQAKPGFCGFARVPTDEDGRFELTTIKPGRVPGIGAQRQAPHLVVNVMMRGLLRHVSTRVYFSDEAEANAEDLVLGSVPEPRRATLVGVEEAPGIYRWDIHMQGELETVFLDF